ncbi:hypothetical protein Nmel_014658 [Mimus melanotis]
MRGEFKKHRW